MFSLPTVFLSKNHFHKDLQPFLEKRVKIQRLLDDEINSLRTNLVVWGSFWASLWKDQWTSSEKTNGRCERFHDRELPLPTQMPRMKDNQERGSLCQRPSNPDRIELFKHITSLRQATVSVCAEFVLEKSSSLMF